MRYSNTRPSSRANHDSTRRTPWTPSRHVITNMLRTRRAHTHTRPDHDVVYSNRPCALSHRRAPLRQLRQLQPPAPLRPVPPRPSEPTASDAAPPSPPSPAAPDTAPPHQKRRTRTEWERDVRWRTNERTTEEEQIRREGKRNEKNELSVIYKLYW
jgi:hypothetical protein